MRAHFLLLCLCFLFNIAAVAQPETQQQMQQKINDELYFNEVTDDVFMITHYFPYYGGNSLLVLLDNKSGVLIDTPYDGVATDVLLEWIKKEFGELRLTAIVTGFHQDNLGGNEVLIRNGIPVYGMKLTADLVEKEGEEFKQIIMASVENNEDPSYFERYSKLKLTPPSNTFTLKAGMSKSITVEKEIFEFYYPGKTHTEDNSVIFIHGKKMLFGGCMIRAASDRRPGYIKYANMQEWPIAVNRVIAKFPQAEIVIPGHGFEGNVQLLQHTVNLLENWNVNHKHD